MFKSQTYGELELKQIPEKLLDYYNRMKNYETELAIIIGTDSQNFSDTNLSQEKKRFQ